MKGNKEGESGVGGKHSRPHSHSERATARPMRSPEASAAHWKCPVSGRHGPEVEDSQAQSVSGCEKSIDSVAFL